jgi:hypothetical protein
MFAHWYNRKNNLLARAILVSCDLVMGFTTIYSGEKPLEVDECLAYSCVNVLTYQGQQIRRIFSQSTHFCNGETQ